MEVMRTFTCATAAGFFTVGMEMFFQSQGLDHHLPLTFLAFAGLFNSAMRTTG